MRRERIITRAGTLFLSLSAAATCGACSDEQATGALPEQQAVKTETKTAADGNAAFAIDLYRKLAGEEEGNLFFSPHSLSTALAMTYAGARGETEAQMARTLHFAPQAQTHAGFAALADELDAAAAPETVQLALASRIWGETGLPVRPEFLATIDRHYGGGYEPADFAADAEKVRAIINAWVEEHTEEKIPELLRQGDIDAQTLMVLTNAIYFKANWQYFFNADETTEQPFNISAERSVQAPLMRQVTRLPAFVAEDLLAVELPYDGDRLSMVVILPRERDGLERIERMLSVEKLASWLGGLEERNVALFLPRFKLRWRSSLEETLAEMGMPNAFGRGADFTGMTTRGEMIIDRVIHEAMVDVNEEGTEAAAATAVTMKRGPGPKMVLFRADHPFICLIRDRQTGSILFMGRVMDPTESTG